MLKVIPNLKYRLFKDVCPYSKVQNFSVLISLVTNIERHQLEVMNAFLSTYTEEEV